ncbi:histidine kinase dimerization/phosphoacceptor domain -containing protein [Flavilitoribacter nigricans]|nr:histidine kinase dimerization/phosphoacceptor domain -containing protein [Flavilitoribacter nigricans]
MSYHLYALIPGVLFILLLSAPPALAQYPELVRLEKLLRESAPQSEECYNLTMELSEFLAISPVPLEEYERLPDFVTFAEESLAWATENGSPTQRARMQRFLVDCYFYTGQNTNFLKLAGEMVAANSFANQEDKIQVYRHLAPIYLDIGYIEKFIELTEELSRIRRDLDEPQAYLVNEHSHIAQAYFRLKDYKRARLHYQEALKVVENGANLLAVASMSNNVGRTYAKAGRPDSAAVYFGRAIDILQAGGTHESGFGSTAYTQHLINRIEANLAMLDLDAGHYDTAIRAVEKELASGKDLTERETVIEACHKLGSLHYQKMNYERALRYLDQAAREIRPQNENRWLLENWEVRYKILLASGQQAAGEQLNKKMTALRDSISSAARDNSAMVASIAYETEKKEKALQEQRNLLVRQDHEITRRKQQQQTFLVGLAGMGILLMVTYSFLQKVRKQKTKIEQQKQQLDKSLREKETLLKEIHHRVKNNLQVVSSILARQGQNSEDIRVKKYMEEGQNRIKSMAMIHQQLYQTQDFEHINLAQYTRLLLVNISDYYKLEEQDIDINIQVAELPLEVDVAIPYGLILNELVSNSYKYGFAGRDHGTLTVAVNQVSENLFRLSVSDDGNGLPEDMERRSEKSLGLNLVKGIAWQLRGKLSYYSNQPGSTFEVTFVNDLKQVA